MKTVITHFSWLEGTDANGESYWSKTAKWLLYLRGIKRHLGFKDVVLFDNGSSMECLRRTGGEILDHNFAMVHPGLPWFKVVSLPPLHRGPGFDYPFVWRGVHMVRELFDDYDKVVVLDHDSYILSQKLAEFVAQRTTGYTALWCPRYNFPECNLQVLCRDFHPEYRRWTRGDFMRRNGLCMETTLPLTFVEKNFVSDRWGEEAEPQRPGMDFYSQCRLKTPMRFVESPA